MASCITFHVEAKSLNPNELSDDLLCSTATYGMTGSKRWKIGNYSEYIDEAKKRGLSCGVPSFLKGKIVNVSNIDLQLMLAQLGVYSEKFDGTFSESVMQSTKRLLANEGFSYIGATDTRVPTFIYETYHRKFSKSDFRDYYCEQILSNRIPLDSETDAYLCELGTTLTEIQSLTAEHLCELATITTSQGKTWGVREKSVYVSQALQNNLLCGIDTDNEPILSVRQIQTRLTSFGYDAGSIDGLWGRKTEKAFSNFLVENYQNGNDPQSKSSVKFLSHYFDQKFNQPVNSGLDCEQLISSYQGGLGKCIIFAKFDEEREVPGDNGTPKTVWDLTLPLVDNSPNEFPTILLVGPDVPVPFTEPYNGPGRSYLAKFQINLSKIFENPGSNIEKINVSQQLPLSSRRRFIDDQNADGYSDLIFTASREDGRGISGKMRNGTYSNMLDYSFLYDLHNDELIKFGKKRFSHDFGMFDFNGDGYKEYLDFSLDKPNGQFGFDFCDGKTLKCKWMPTNHFINGNSWLAHDPVRNVVNVMATCGSKFIKNPEENVHYCIFDTNYKNGNLQFELVSKFRPFPEYNNKYTFKNFFGRVAVEKGYTTPQSKKEGVFYRPQNFQTQQIDLNGDSQAEIVFMHEELVCTINDDRQHIYSYDDCPGRRYFSQVYSFRDGGYYHDEKLSQINFSFNTIQTIDLNKDGKNDIILQSGGCNPTSWSQYKSLIGLNRHYINKGDGEYEAINDDIISTVNCNLGEIFFKRDEHIYRVFKFKNSTPEDAWRDTEVFLAIEQVVFDEVSALRDDEVCSKAISYFYSSEGQTAKWSITPQNSKYVTEAKMRRLSCGIE